MPSLSGKIFVLDEYRSPYALPQQPLTFRWPLCFSPDSMLPSNTGAMQKENHVWAGGPAPRNGRVDVVNVAEVALQDIRSGRHLTVILQQGKQCPTSVNVCGANTPTMVPTGMAALNNQLLLGFKPVGTIGNNSGQCNINSDWRRWPGQPALDVGILIRASLS